MDYGWRFKVIFNRRGHGGFRRGRFRTASGPGSPSGQPAWGGGCDRPKPSSQFKINNLRATLHFIDPNVEIGIASTLLASQSCARAIDDAMLAIASLDGMIDAEMFPPNPATHCRMCNFRELCQAGQDWLRQRGSEPPAVAGG